MGNLLPAARLRRLTHLTAITRKATRWSSTYAMLKRYIAIRGFVHQLNDRTILSLLPTDEQDKEIDILLGILGELESGTKDLQAEDSTILDARNLFDETILLYPDAAKRLGPNADILVSPIFESAVTKLLNNAAGQLSAVERESVCGLQMNFLATQNPSDKPLTLAERAKKRKKTSHEEFNYLDCRFLRPTSNMCERFFSLAKLALTDHRRAMTPQNFEQQMFLKVNNWLWNVSDLVKAMSK
ncbi:hypothetical protein DYB35_011310 [Aphanomyces astaci]|uniref:HAT C-terminal dimerisation domain-containing protein n=1 Tax=Aphanomyces astaci TaxID=112090 RepID=A0A418D9Z6_APHAT|nr:hypothetical protein DYB35_011310 [Aphanomyces astaci]